MLIESIDFLVLQFYTTFGDVDHDWGHKVDAKQNLVASFLPHFSTDLDEI